MKRLIIITLLLLATTVKAQDTTLIESRQITVTQSENFTTIQYLNAYYKTLTDYDHIILSNDEFETFKKEVVEVLTTKEKKHTEKYSIMPYTKKIAMVFVSNHSYFYISTKLIDKL